MIDWDEVFEDVNWKRGVVIVVGAFILIVAAILLGLDYHQAKLLQGQMDSSLSELARFSDQWSPPDAAELEKLKAEVEKWDQVLAKSGLSRRENPEDGLFLPTKFDLEAIQNQVRQAAAKYGLELAKIGPQAEFTDGYCRVQPIEVVFSSGNGAAINGFMQSITSPHGFKSDITAVGGPVRLTVEFYGFDLEDWRSANDCEVKFTMPEPPPEITGVYLFKGGLNDLRSKVEQESARLTDLKRKVLERCELEAQIDRRKRECAAVKDKLKIESLECKVE